MSKSYRYDPDEEGYADSPRWKRTDGDAAGADGAMPHDVPLRRKEPRRAKRGKEAPQHSEMTPEWAIELMKDKVSMTVGTLLTQRVILPCEREDYVQQFNILVWKLLPQYDPARADANGVNAGVERFLSVAIDNAAKNVKMRVARRRRNFPEVPFIDLSDCGDGEDDGEDGEGTPCEGNPFKDHRRHMEALWLRMDLEVLSRKLTMEERLTLACRLSDFTYQEIAEYVSDRLGVKVLRYHIMEYTMASLRKKALECGFEPYPVRAEGGE